jgi:hypothetical protein
VKVTALFLVICMVFVSVFTAKADSMRMAANCCHKMTKSLPCDHHPQQKNNCGQGMCTSMLSCNTCGFLGAEPVSITVVVPVLKEAAVTSHSSGSLSAYSSSSWRPPKV